MRGPPELATLLRHAAEHSVPINLSRGTDEEEKEAAIRYGTHTSAIKDIEFIHADPAEQVQAGHVVVSPLEAVNALHNLWLSLVAVTPQAGRQPQLIFDSIWIRLNNISQRLAPMEAMHFGGALQKILKQVFTANPRLRPV